MAFYICIIIVLFAFEVLYLQFASKMGIVDRPHYQSSHTGVVVRGGGLIFYIAYFLWAVLNGHFLNGGLYGLTILATVSFIDDNHSVSPQIRLFCQFISILLMFYHSGLIQNQIYVIVLLSVACVATVNIFNFMDGINGMTGGYSLVVALALLYVNKYKVSFIQSELIVFIILSLIVFNYFNFRGKAKCFAGDVGSMSIGYILVYMILRLALKDHSMSWLAMIIVYAVDGGLTILHRIILRENLMKPHKKHVYQIMANELKMPHLMVSGIYMGLQAVCSAFYIVYPGYITLFGELISLTMLYLLFMYKFYGLHKM